MQTVLRCGASDRSGRIPTVEALRKALEDHPACVFFDATVLGGFDILTGTTMPEFVTLTVTGPNPFSDEQWTATVTRKGQKWEVNEWKPGLN